jgi:hypothetical protein
MAGRKHNTNFTIGGVPVVSVEWMPPNEILIIIPEQRTRITYHEGASDGKTLDVVVREQRIIRAINIEIPPSEEMAGIKISSLDGE